MAVLLRIPGYAPTIPPTDQLRDKGLSAAGDLNGAHLPDGIDTSKTWEVVGNTVAWAYTGTTMKPTSGATSLALVDTGSNHGRASAHLAALKSSSPVISLIFRATDVDNYLRFGVSSAGVWALYRRQAAANTTLWTSTVTAVAGDVLAVRVVDESTISMYVNGSLINAFSAPSALAALTGTKWGMHGSFTTDAVSALSDFIWNAS